MISGSFEFFAFHAECRYQPDSEVELWIVGLDFPVAGGSGI